MSYLASLSATELSLRRLLPLVAGALLLFVVFLQLRRHSRAPAAGRPGFQYDFGRRTLAALLALALPALLVALGAFIFAGGQWQAPLKSAQRTVAAGQDRARGGHSPQPEATVPPIRILAPDPAAVTLQSRDLPPGFHVLKANKASFSTGGDAYPSWDVIFEPDATNPAPAYPLAESLAVVYPSENAAARAVDAQSAVDRSGGAAPYVPSSKVGDQVTVWVEKTSNRPEYAVVRVTWRYVNVVGQVSMLTPSRAVRPEQALTLANREQERIKASVLPVQSLASRSGS